MLVERAVRVDWKTRGGAGKSLVGATKTGKLAPRRSAVTLLNRDIFPWLGAAAPRPSIHAEWERAATIVEDRLCCAVANQFRTRQPCLAARIQQRFPMPTLTKTTKPVAKKAPPVKRLITVSAFPGLTRDRQRTAGQPPETWPKTDFPRGPAMRLR